MDATIATIVIAFVTLGIAWASTFCKTAMSTIFVGILLGLGIVFVIAGVIFAGCAMVFGSLKL